MRREDLHGTWAMEREAQWPSTRREPVKEKRDLAVSRLAAHPAMKFSAATTRTSPTPLHAEHYFSLMVPCPQSLVSLFGLFQRKHVIEVDRELVSVDEFCQFGQLSPIRPEVEQIRVNVTRGCHLLKINNRDEPPTIAHHLQTPCGCLSTNAVQDGIDALGMSRVNCFGKVCLCIINEFAGS